MTYNPRDHYFKLAKQKNFLARSVFKIDEIDEKLRLFRSGQKILDLGAAPGSWTQFGLRKVGDKGWMVSVDLQPIKVTSARLKVWQGDIRECPIGELKEQCQISHFDIVMSDMAPKTTGIRITDQMRSLELCELALDVAIQHLGSGGVFICKLFQSEEFENFRNKLKSHFSNVNVVRPKSTRKESKEIFLIGTGFRASLRQ